MFCILWKRPDLFKSASLHFEYIRHYLEQTRTRYWHCFKGKFATDISSKRLRNRIFINNLTHTFPKETGTTLFRLSCWALIYGGYFFLKVHYIHKLQKNKVKIKGNTLAAWVTMLIFIFSAQEHFIAEAFSFTFFIYRCVSRYKYLRKSLRKHYRIKHLLNAETQTNCKLFICFST